MKRSEKRGQFYLIAAIILAIIIMGLNYTYSAAKGGGNKLDVYGLAQEIRYEVKQLVENLVLKGKTESEIASNIKGNVSDYYLKRFVNTEIAIVYSNETKSYIINKTGVSEVIPSSGKINVGLLGAQHEIDISKQNIYVLVGIEKEGEKDIAIE